MNDSSIDETILDSDVDTSCVSNNDGEVDPSGLLGLGGVESPLVAALDEVIESNNTDTDLLVDVEGGGKHLDPKDKEDTLNVKGFGHKTCNLQSKSKLWAVSHKNHKNNNITHIKSKICICSLA